jgi:hypothetical protein
MLCSGPRPIRYLLAQSCSRKGTAPAFCSTNNVPCRYKGQLVCSLIRAASVGNKRVDMQRYHEAHAYQAGLMLQGTQKIFSTLLPRLKRRPSGFDDMYVTSMKPCARDIDQLQIAAAPHVPPLGSQYHTGAHGALPMLPPWSHRLAP